MVTHEVVARNRDVQCTQKEGWGLVRAEQFGWADYLFIHSFFCATASVQRCHPTPAPCPLNWHLHLVGCVAPEWWDRLMPARRHHHRCIVVTIRAASFVTLRRCKRTSPVPRGDSERGWETDAENHMSLPITRSACCAPGSRAANEVPSARSNWPLARGPLISGHCKIIGLMEPSRIPFFPLYKVLHS